MTLHPCRALRHERWGEHGHVCTRCKRKRPTQEMRPVVSALDEIRGEHYECKRPCRA